MTTTTQQLLHLLEAWVPQQRWFGGKGRDIASVTADPVATVGAATIWLTTVEYVDGVAER